MITKITFDVNF